MGDQSMGMAFNSDAYADDRSCSGQRDKVGVEAEAEAEAEEGIVVVAVDPMWGRGSVVVEPAQVPGGGQYTM